MQQEEKVSYNIASKDGLIRVIGGNYE